MTSTDPILQAVTRLGQLTCLRLRLEFEATSPGPALHVDEQVWRGALKKHLPPTVCESLFDPKDARRGIGSRSRPPGIMLWTVEPEVDLAFTSVEMVLFGSACANALHCVQALAAGAWNGLSASKRRLTLSQQRVLHPDGVLRNLPLFADGKELAALAHPIRHGVTRLARHGLDASDTSHSIALRFLSALVVADGGGVEPAPTLGSVARLLSLRADGLLAVWGDPTDACEPLDDLLEELLVATESIRCQPQSTWQPAKKVNVTSKKRGESYPSSGHRGVLLYDEVPAPWVEWLGLGQVIGLGQQTTMGRGRYQLLVSGASAQFDG